MEVGVSTATMFLRAYNEDALPLLDKIDARVVEIFLESFCEYTTEYAELLKSKLGNLKVHSVHTLNTHFEPQFFSVNERAKADAFKIFEQVLKSMKLLNAQNYTMHGRMRVKKDTNFTNYAQTAKDFNVLCDFAKSYGANVCLENVEWAMYSKAGYFSNVKDLIPTLKACLDIKQARIAGDDYSLYLDEMGDRLKTVHVSDYDENGRILLPGRGLFDFKKLIDKLHAVNFDGALLIEVYKESFESLDEVASSLEYIRKIIKEG